MIGLYKMDAGRLFLYLGKSTAKSTGKLRSLVKRGENATEIIKKVS